MVRMEWTGVNFGENSQHTCMGLYFQFAPINCKKMLQFRDTVRQFIKGTDGVAGSFAHSLCGSPQIYQVNIEPTPLLCVLDIGFLNTF